MLVDNPSKDDMSRTQAEFRSERCAGYLSTMARHFSQKIEVTQVDDAVHLHFICGLAVLSLNDDALHIRIISPSAPQMQQTCEVVESHLLRFAFREEFENMPWES